MWPAPVQMQQHALVPRSGQLLRSMRPLSGVFWLSRLHAERAALTADAALEFCGGAGEEGCNCCCDGAVLGPVGFLADVNQCTADYCYDFNVTPPPPATPHAPSHWLHPPLHPPPPGGAL